MTTNKKTNPVESSWSNFVHPKESCPHFFSKFKGILTPTQSPPYVRPHPATHRLPTPHQPPYPKPLVSNTRDEWRTRWPSRWTKILSTSPLPWGSKPMFRTLRGQPLPATQCHQKTKWNNLEKTEFHENKKQWENIETQWNPMKK